MAFVTIEDLYGSIEVIVFPKTLEQYQNFIYDGSIISVSGTLSLEEEKDAKILAGVIAPPPTEAGTQSGNENKKRRKKALYLRFKNKEDKNIFLAKRVTTIFDGTIPLYFYYTESGEYELQPRADFVEVNETELKELKRILGDENVVYKG